MGVSHRMSGRPRFSATTRAGLIDFEQQIHRAVLFGAGLKEIGRAAEEIAIRYATEEEKGNVHRAACRLGVTDRTLQLRRATRRQADEPRGFAVTPASERSGARLDQGRQ